MAVGAVGADGGLLWIVAGVWAVRAVAGSRLGLAWGIAAVGAGMRWGTLSLTDIEVATRIAGPTLFAGPLVVRTGMAVSAIAALVGEGHVGGFVARTWGERAAAAAVVASLPPLFIVRGPGAPLAVTAGWWAVASIMSTVFVLLGRRGFTRVPATVPPILAAAGVAAAVVAA